TPRRIVAAPRAVAGPRPQHRDIDRHVAGTVAPHQERREMIIDFKGTQGVPVGTYAAEFVRVEEFDNPERSDLPPAVKFVWRVTAGEHEGQEATRICSLKYGPKAALPKFLRSVMGRDPEKGEQIDIAKFAGVT